MLRELAVRNLALIEDVRVELEAGFCAWTGETGAGKTLLLAAVGLLLGERGSTDLIRAGADELHITGRFVLNRPSLREAVETLLERPLDDDELILSRRLTRGGRSFAYLNDQPTAVATLKRLGSTLVDMHSQHESQALLDPLYQLRLLDAYGGLTEQRREYSAAAEAVRGMQLKLRTLEGDRQQRQRELSLLRFERDELDAAELVPDQLEDLAAERERLAHAQSLLAFYEVSTGMLYDNEGSLVEQLGKIERDAEHWLGLVPALADFIRRLDGVRAETQDLAETLRGLSQELEIDQGHRDEVESRLRLLRRLEVKYGRSNNELIAYRGQLDEQEKSLAASEDDRTRTQTDLEAAFTRVKSLGIELGKKRQRAAKRLATAVQKELAELGMAEARLDVRLDSSRPSDDPVETVVPLEGFETLELMLAANPGELGHPLRKVASGGELSRTLLAIKTVLAAHDQRVTLVFDEIDANVGGRLGDVLGEKLATLGKTHQVICITHLPQVACYAPRQWSIRKARQGKRTTTTITPLTDDARIDELAIMLRGESRSESTRREAAAMLAAAREKW
ncbi:MAG TPA: DNA repair protein RecN [Gemmataceae bacterium]|jgi:DNA repair protein RecN (Recombination protein N)|nr:DNA repair protein RecN [Gemmataceae bacterium]